jgi:hypothetical protein
VEDLITRRWTNDPGIGRNDAYLRVDTKQKREKLLKQLALELKGAHNVQITESQVSMKIASLKKQYGAIKNTFTATGNPLKTRPNCLNIGISLHAAMSIINSNATDLQESGIKTDFGSGWRRKLAGCRQSLLFWSLPYDGW